MAERGSRSGRVGEAETASFGARRRRTPQLVDVVRGLGREEIRALADELGAIWRGDSTAGERAAARLATLFRELGLVTRAELEEADLRIAQLEHRLRPLESGRSTDR